MGSEVKEEQAIDVLIMAAGLGTRMRSGLAKVLHRLSGRPLINHVCSTAAVLGPEKIYVVIGHQGDDVKTAVLSEMDADAVEFALQKEQLGTGDAVNSARSFLEGRGSTVLILSGDVPLIRHETLSEMISQHHDSGAACTVLTVRLDNPTGYGRVIRSDDGNFDRIVEQKDANESELAVNEINSGIYCFDTKKLFAALANVKNNNAQGEYYLTDVPAMFREAGDTVGLYVHDDRAEIEGINDRVQLAEMERMLRERTIDRLMRESGVTFIDPQNTYISERAKFGRDTVVYSNVTVEGTSEIGSGCVIRPGTRISNAKIGDGVEILDNCLIVDSEVGNACKVGPMAHLRGHAVMTEGSKVGNFVELKKTVLGKGSKASHLTYLGDATIGEKTNIGAGTITCNYDGKNKHQTEIGNNVRIGSDTMLVAPVKVGDGASTGAGSVVTKDIEPGDLVVGVPARTRK
ncbi:MAG: bifunctional UDP-N-acetylglucosamine diphosphorylase/glucosamine-1-phosphate N-acetyltransferase GlmU [Acidobacteria bacterium]|nr:bifunctional UDP-N-acetylglucosamine diphosphorylase/glucosamine-1-phosphate N-acetyltransferase GlmU [Acidobacteriota bacterium]